MSAFDWNSFRDASSSLTRKCNEFHYILEESFKAAIPSRIVTFTKQSKPWITHLLKSLINDRWNAYRERNFSLYIHLKKKVKLEIEKSKLLWVKKMKKNVWEVINNMCPRKVSNPMDCIYSKYSCIEAAATDINAHLIKVFSPRASLPIPSDSLPQNFISTTTTQVRTLLEKLSVHKASPELPCKLYKAAALILAEPLAHLINQSLERGEIPVQWKTSTVIPLPKTNTPKTIDEVRPISLLPIPSKILEKVVLNFAKPIFLREYGDTQFGFRSGSSTTCALIVLHDQVTKFLDDKSVAGVQVVTYDFSKAFDRLRHDVIIQRLIDCKMPVSLVRWVSNYLDSRYQVVSVGSVRSSSMSVSSGVPQGSLLGPFLFSVVMGSLQVQSPNCHIIKYADDVTLCMPIHKNSSNSHISHSHNQLLSWSTAVGLQLNMKKCKTLVIPRSTVCSPIVLPGIQTVKQITLLGVVFNDKWTWKEQVDKIVKTASRRLFPLRICKPYVTAEDFINAYYGIMRSVMEYAAPLLIGMSKTDAERLQRLQNRFHRLLCGKSCSKECLPSLTERREKLSAKLYRSAENKDHILHQVICQTSRSGRYILPHINTTRRLNTFTIKTALLLNDTSKNL